MAKKFTIEQAIQVGEALGVDWITVDPKLFHAGMNIELEHGTITPDTNITDDDPIMTGKIALAHINESGDAYYKYLPAMEKVAKKSMPIDKKAEVLHMDPNPQYAIDGNNPEMDPANSEQVKEVLKKYILLKKNRLGR